MANPSAMNASSSLPSAPTRRSGLLTVCPLGLRLPASEVAMRYACLSRRRERRARRSRLRARPGVGHPTAARTGCTSSRRRPRGRSRYATQAYGTADNWRPDRRPHHPQATRPREFGKYQALRRNLRTLGAGAQEECDARCSASHRSLIQPSDVGVSRPGTRILRMIPAATATIPAPTMISIWFSLWHKRRPCLQG